MTNEYRGISVSQPRKVIAALSGLLLLLFGGFLWRELRPLADPSPSLGATSTASPVSPGSRASSASPSPSPSASAPASMRASASASSSASSGPPQSSAPASPTSTGSAPAVPAGCAASATPMTPTRFAVPRMGVDTRVLSVGLAADGTIGTPPINDKTSVSWFDEGPRPGAAKGQAILTAHTYHVGGALGNQLMGAGGLKVGDIVTVSDGTRTLCYRYSGATKVWVKDYDPNSTVMVNDNGAPRMVMVICWDYHAGRRSWDSRMIFGFEPLAQT